MKNTIKTVEELRSAIEVIRSNNREAEHTDFVSLFANMLNQATKDTIRNFVRAEGLDAGDNPTLQYISCNRSYYMKTTKRELVDIISWILASNVIKAREQATEQEQAEPEAVEVPEVTETVPAKIERVKKTDLAEIIQAKTEHNAGENPEAKKSERIHTQREIREFLQNAETPEDYLKVFERSELKTIREYAINALDGFTFSELKKLTRTEIVDLLFSNKKGSLRIERDKRIAELVEKLKTSERETVLSELVKQAEAEETNVILTLI